jgi:hypothetical protein
MTDNFQEIDGVGPAREEDLADADYESYADLAEVDAATLGEEIPRLSEDKALDIIVQAQNLADLEEAEAEANPEVEEETIGVSQSYGNDEADDSDEEEVEAEATEEPERYTVELTVESDAEYDAFYDALLQHRQTLIGTNRPGVGRATEYIDRLREATVGDTLTFELTADELNGLHNSVMQHRLDYQGRNLREQLDALRRIENRVNDLREEYLF